jgi:hypothetical protein
MGRYRARSGLYQCCNVANVIPEIDIRRAATLMLKRVRRQGSRGKRGTRRRVLAAHNDYHGQATWRRITEAVSELANMTPPTPPH